MHIANDIVNNKIDTVNDTVKNQNDTVFSLIKHNNKITANELALKLGKSIATIKRKIKDLKDRKVIERIGSDKTGSWKILKEDEEQKNLRPKNVIVINQEISSNKTATNFATNFYRIFAKVPFFKVLCFVNIFLYRFKIKHRTIAYIIVVYRTL